MSLRICALIAARNEMRYLGELLPRLAAQRIDVVLIDNGSDDGSEALYRQFHGAPLIALEREPFDGVFRLQRLLERKRELAMSLPHDWVVHQDADELLEFDAPGHDLRAAIERADAGGWNAIDFDEFVFLPYEAGTRSDASYPSFSTYYHFAPMPNRLNRAWRRDAGLDNRHSGGHQLGGAVRLAPERGALRHFIGLSESHLREKYVGRRFDPAALARGWHGNRIGLTARMLTLPRRDHPALRQLEHSDSRALRRDAPQATHYWHWPRPSWWRRLRGG